MSYPTGVTWKAVCDADFKAGDIVEVRVDLQNGYTHIKRLTITSVDMGSPFVAAPDGIRLKNEGKVTP